MSRRWLKDKKKKKNVISQSNIEIITKLEGKKINSTTHRLSCIYRFHIQNEE